MAEVLTQYPVNGKRIAPKQSADGGTTETMLDGAWVRTAFVLPNFNDEAGKPRSNPVDIRNRYWSTAQAKFTDGRFGCNIGINCPSQFTPYADIPAKGKIVDRQDVSIHDSLGNFGPGTYWNEMYDDNAQIVYMRFGVPEFNSFFDFFSGAFNHGQGVLARTGRSPLLYNIASFIGSAIVLRAFPIVAVPMLIGKTLDYFFFRQSAKYYHMKPTMHLYWGAVNTLVNTLAMNSGIYPKSLMADVGEAQRIGQPFEVRQTDLDIYNALAPDIFNSVNYIDVFALANRAQRIANRVIADDFERLNNESNTAFEGYVMDEVNGNGRHATRFTDVNGERSIMDLINNFMSFEKWYKVADDTVTPMEPDIRTANKEKTKEYLYGDQVSMAKRLANHLDAEFRMGGQFAIFRVEHTGATTESFSNSVTPSDLENKFNSTSSSYMHKRFTLGNGAIFGDIVETAAGAVTDVAMGALNGVTFGLADAVKGLLGDGYIDIPQHWQSSSASLPRAQYRMVLTTPYGNVISRIFKLFVPFAMIAAGAWPRSTGRQSYTAPFLCQLFDRGRVQVPLGMITEMTVVRGSGNLGYTQDGKPLSMEVTWTVTDLSRILHMPLMSVWDSSNRTMIDEESTITNYLAAVAGQSIENQIYPSTRAKIRLAKLVMNAGVISSPAFWASWLHDKTTNGVLGMIGNPIEALMRNTENTSGSVF